VGEPLVFCNAVGVCERQRPPGAACDDARQCLTTCLGGTCAEVERDLCEFGEKE